MIIYISIVYYDNKYYVANYTQSQLRMKDKLIFKILVGPLRADY